MSQVGVRDRAEGLEWPTAFLYSRPSNNVFFFASCLGITERSKQANGIGLPYNKVGTSLKILNRPLRKGFEREATRCAGSQHRP